MKRNLAADAADVKPGAPQRAGCRLPGHRVARIREMSDAADTKDCPRCAGSGKYADPQRGPLVQVTCERCDGSGRVASDAADEPPAKEPTQIPFGSRPD